MREAPGRPAISAHRGGGEVAAAGTYEAYRSALASGAEYVEFDVRRTSDGQLVSYHGARAPWGRAIGTVSYARLCDLAGYQVPLVTEIMRLLAGRAIGHLDLKETVDAHAIIAQALDVLRPGGFVVTTGAAPVASAIKRRFPGVPVALTIGGDLVDTARFTWDRARTPGLTRLARVVACMADWAAVHYRAARNDLLRECRRQAIQTMVWTVNGDRALGRWLAHPCVDVVVTDRPAGAVVLRGRMTGQSGRLSGDGHIAPVPGNDGDLRRSDR